MPSTDAVAMMRTAISPRLATSSLLIMRRPRSARCRWRPPPGASPASPPPPVSADTTIVTTAPGIVAPPSWEYGADVSPARWRDLRCPSALISPAVLSPENHDDDTSSCTRPRQCHIVVVPWRASIPQDGATGAARTTLVIPGIGRVRAPGLDLSFGLIDDIFRLIRDRLRCSGDSFWLAGDRLRRIRRGRIRRGRIRRG